MKKRNKWRFAGAVLIMGCLLAGCSVPSDKGEGMESGMSVRETELSAGAADMGTLPLGADSSTRSGNTKEDLPKVSELNNELFDGSDMDLWDAGNERLIALKENTLYLYDVAGEKIIAEGKTESWFIPYIYPCHDGFCIIGAPEDNMENSDEGADGSFRVIEASDDQVWLAVFYDNALHEKKRILLNDIAKYPDATLWSVSPDMTMLAYFDLWEGLCIYDCNKESPRQILDFSGPVENVSGLLAPDTLYFDEEKERLVFSGGTAKGDVTVESWGCINLDGTGFENHILKKDAGMAAAYKNGKLLSGEDSLSFEKIMGYADTVTGEEKYSTNIEGGNTIGGPVFSDTGETFAVTDIKDNQAVLTIYNTADFSEIYREVIRDEQEELFYRSPRVCLFDKSRVCLVCMGGYEVPLKALIIKY